MHERVKQPNQICLQQVDVMVNSLFKKVRLIYNIKQCKTHENNSIHFIWNSKQKTFLASDVFPFSCLWKFTHANEQKSFWLRTFAFFSKKKMEIDKFCCLTDQNLHICRWKWRSKVKVTLSMLQRGSWQTQSYVLVQDMK